METLLTEIKKIADEKAGSEKSVSRTYTAWFLHSEFGNALVASSHNLEELAKNARDYLKTQPTGKISIVVTETNVRVARVIHGKDNYT